MILCTVLFGKTEFLTLMLATSLEKKKYKLSFIPLNFAVTDFNTLVSGQKGQLHAKF